MELVKKKKKDTCAICLEETKYALKECGHYFHKKCIKEVYKTGNQCPMCRQNLCKLAIDKKKFIDTPFSLENNCNGLVDINIINI